MTSRQSGRPRSVRRLGGILLLLIAAIVLSSLASPRSHAVPGLGIDTSGAALTGIHKIEHVDRDHAGEPVVRRVLRDVPRRRRHPDRRQRPARPSACPIPRTAGARRRTPTTPTTTAAVRTARRRPRPTSTAARWTASSIAAEAAQRDCTDADEPELRRTARSTSWATTPRPTSRTTGSTRATSCSRTACSSRTRRGACPSTCSMVSEWSARCSVHNDPTSAARTRSGTDPRRARHAGAASPIYAWTDLTYLLHKNDVSWGYYVVDRCRARLRGRRRR